MAACFLSFPTTRTLLPDACWFFKLNFSVWGYTVMAASTHCRRFEEAAYSKNQGYQYQTMRPEHKVSGWKIDKLIFPNMKQYYFFKSA